MPMGTEVYSVNPYMKNAHSPKAKFDISHNNGVWTIGSPQRRESDPTINLSKAPPETWELDVRPQIGSRKWLQNYGLKKNRLTLAHLLPSIGFKLSDDFDRQVKSPISSRYGGGLFSQVFRPDGKTFNITGSKEKLHQIKKRLSQAISLFRRRLEWLTTESRRVFGVIEEKSVTIIMDIKNLSPQQFDQYRVALERVLREQVMQLAKFNLIRASEDMDRYNTECVPVTHDTIENAIQWMWNLDRLASISKTATCEAVLHAVTDKNNEAVYLFTEGTSVDSSRELLKEKILSAEHKLPMHIVSFNCDSADTIKFLRDFTKATGGRFHAYAVVMEMDAYEAQPLDPLTNKANIVLKKKTYGGLPAGVGVREDIVLVFEELEEARNIKSQIQALIDHSPEPKSFELKTETPQQREKAEQCMSSREWLGKYGLVPQRLGLYHVLSGVAFRHQDGVVELMDPPPEDTQTNAIQRPKLVNARYCEQFPVVQWKDGSVVHVQVTPEIHRGYEQKMEVALNKLQQRLTKLESKEKDKTFLPPVKKKIDWLQQGSRALFGSIIEDQIYVLIDTSASMQPNIQFVKDKLFILMQEQLRHKAKFNLVSFNSKSSVWRDRLVLVNERNLQSAWGWVQGLACWGSTNTYAAIQQAMSDPQTQAIYLLTDGRPDQPPKSILAQVQMRNKVPIHAISFNCNDIEANRFLFELARVTGGRYHSYSENGEEQPTEEQPETYESEDIYLLREEMKQGMEYLDQLAKLRDECTTMSWKREIEALKKCSKNHTLSENDRVSSVPPLDTKELYRPSSPMSRPQSAPPQEPRHVPTPPPRPSSSQGFRHSSERKISGRPTSARHRRNKPLIASSSSMKKSKPKPLVKGHTRTSLLRTLNSGGRFSAKEWLLPETKQLFQNQAVRQQKLQEHDERRDNSRKFRYNRLLRANDLSSKQWLAKFGLVAKRLTILDALSPTFIPHKAKYVPILDKHVMARVFDEILPLAHVSGGKKAEIRLISPSGVNLKLYEEKLLKAKELYIRRLNKIVWDVLPQEVKNEYDEEGPVSFLDNREHLIKALDEANWPIREKDITLMEEEIGRAMKFLQHSQDLRKEASDEFLDDRGSVTPNSLLRTSRDSENCSEVIPTTANYENKEKDFKVSKQNVSFVLQTLRGLKVIARDKKDGLYYPAFVKSCSNPREATVIDTENGTEQLIQTRFLIPISGAVPVPPLQVRDCVLLRVLTLKSEIECYVPGIVQAIPADVRKSLSFYSVDLYNKQKVTTMRKNLVKISQERYNLTVCYIQRMQSENEEHYRPPNPVPPESDEESVNEWKMRADDLQRQLEEHERTKVDLEQMAQDLERKLEEKQDLEKRFHHENDEWEQMEKDLKSKLEDQEKKRQEWEVKKKYLKSKLKDQEKKRHEWKKKAKNLKRQLHEQQRMQTETEHEEAITENPNHLSEDVEIPVEIPVEKSVEIPVEKSVMKSQLFELRKSLPEVMENEEVLIRWSDDGWYYRGIIHENYGDYRYSVQDSTGNYEVIFREDIITDEDDGKEVIEVDDYVVAMHPVYPLSYAPGRVVNIFHDSRLQIHFYDGEESKLFRDDVFKLSQYKYEYDVNEIRQYENRWVGSPVIVRNDKTGVYDVATVKEKCSKGQCYIIEWLNGKLIQQDPIHMFGVFTQRRELKKNGHILAIADDNSNEYLPGVVKQIHESRKTFDVAFCDGTVKKNTKLDKHLYFWLSENYYNNAVTYFLKRHPH